MLCDGAASDRVEAFSGGEHDEYFVLLLERASGRDEAVDVVLELAIVLRAGCVEINGAVLAVLVRAGGDARDIFCDGGFYRPHERVNRTQDEDGSFLVPAGVAQGFAAVGARMRFERPCGVGA